MSVLPPEATAELSQLLQALQSPDNTARTQAEEHLQNNWTATRPEVLLMGLAEQIGSHASDATRSFAAVIFRRIALKSRVTNRGVLSEIFISLPAEQAQSIRQAMLQLLSIEKDRGVRNKISDAVAEIARQYTDNDQAWPELLQTLFNLAKDESDAGKRETAFRVFSSTPGAVERVHEAALVQAFSAGFQDQSVSVRIAAMEAFASFFRGLPKKQQAKYHYLIPEMLNILPPFRDSHDSDDLGKALFALIDLAGISHKPFRPVFNTLVQFSISVIQDKEFTDICRQNALELMATFAETSPSMCNKDPNYIEEIIKQCLSLMTDVGEDDDDGSEWLDADDLDEDDNDANHVVGGRCMDRLATNLDDAIILNRTYEWLPQMIESPSWQYRHAALMAISAISEGCRDRMLPKLDAVLQMVKPSLSDPHPRVRWAGCNAVGQMCTDFAPTMQQEHYDFVLKNLIPVLDSTEPRVKSHAAAALVNFCEEAEKSVLEPYLDDLLGRLFNLLQCEKRYVQEQALSTIATIADAAEQVFAKYYDTLMPQLMQVLLLENTKEYRLLRAKAMECATLIALAVGRERVGKNAIELVNLLTTVQNNLEDADDPQVQYLMHSWGRMCRLMRAEFLPYLQTALPPLLVLASAKADIQLIDDEEEADKLRQEEGWDIVPVKGKIVGINTSSMDDKHMAIELLVVFAQALEGAFAPYVPNIMEEVALPSLDFFHDPVRYVAARLVVQLLGSFKKAYGAESNELNSLWAATLPKLLAVLATQPAIDALAELYQCFYESVEVLGRACLTTDHMNTFIDVASQTLDDYRVRATDRERDKAAASDDEEEDEDLLIELEDDQTLLSDLSKSFHVIFKYHGADFLESWKRLLETYNVFLQSADASQRQWGLCIVDDVVEYCGSKSYEYEALIKPPLLRGCSDPSPTIRQPATYGVGVAAQRGGPAWAPFLGECLPYLLQATMFPDARGEDSVYATENACAAIAKILHFNAGAVENTDAVIAQWISTLPVVNDEEAAPYVYAFLAELISRRHPAVMTQGEVVFMYIAQGLGADVLRGETATRVVEAAKVLVAETGVDATKVLQQFPPELQQTISAYFM